MSGHMNEAGAVRQIAAILVLGLTVTPFIYRVVLQMPRQLAGDSEHEGSVGNYELWLTPGYPPEFIVSAIRGDMSKPTPI